MVCIHCTGERCGRMWEGRRGVHEYAGLHSCGTMNNLFKALTG